MPGKHFFAGLRLITCGGEFDRQARSYDDNIVAFADLVGFTAATPQIAAVDSSVPMLG